MSIDEPEGFPEPSRVVLPEPHAVRKAVSPMTTLEMTLPRTMLRAFAIPPTPSISAADTPHGLGLYNSHRECELNALRLARKSLKLCAAFQMMVPQESR